MLHTNRSGKIVYLLALLCVFLLILVGALLYFFAFSSNDSGTGRGSGGSITNPAKDLSEEEIIANFNAEFLRYLLIQVRAYELHNPPFSDNKPVIEFLIDEESYAATVDDGSIIVVKGVAEEEDILIVTTKREAAKMLQDESYIQTSFSAGSSWVELRAGKTTLVSKGYVGVYESLTGQKVTDLL